jgi:hypothetical protein
LTKIKERHAATTEDHLDPVAESPMNIAENWFIYLAGGASIIFMIALLYVSVEDAVRHRR